MDRLAEKMSTITSSSARVSDALRDQRKKVAELSGKATSFFKRASFSSFQSLFYCMQMKILAGVRSDSLANCTTTKATEVLFCLAGSALRIAAFLLTGGEPNPSYLC